MHIAIAALLAAVAFTVLIRLLWLNTKPVRSGTVVALAAVALVIGLGVLAASGRLHWLAAAGAATLPFLRRGVGLLRYVPWLRQLFSSVRNARSSRTDGASSSSGSAGGRFGRGAMSRDHAREILGLGTHPTSEEVVAAHRRLMQKLHPDRGGSTFLAQQLNEAKRVLLDGL